MAHLKNLYGRSHVDIPLANGGDIAGQLQAVVDRCAASVSYAPGDHLMR
jgi:hypothetical protein